MQWSDLMTKYDEYLTCKRRREHVEDMGIPGVDSITYSWKICKFCGTKFGTKNIYFEENVPTPEGCPVPEEHKKKAAQKLRIKAEKEAMWGYEEPVEVHEKCLDQINKPGYKYPHDGYRSSGVKCGHCNHAWEIGHKCPDDQPEEVEQIRERHSNKHSHAWSEYKNLANQDIHTLLKEIDKLKKEKNDILLVERKCGMCAQRRSECKCHTSKYWD